MDFDIFDLLGESEDVAPTTEKWEPDHVLTTRSFPSTVIYREQANRKSRERTCICSDAERHRSFFDFCKSVVRPNLKEGKEIPTDVKVCWNARNIFEMDLPRELIHTEKNGKVRIDGLKTVGDIEYCLRKGTYWYNRAAYKDGSIRNGLTDLGRQLLILIAGLESGNHHHNSAGALRKRESSKQGLQRLRNLLSTIDGIIIQIALCFPGEQSASWDTYDRIIHNLLRNLTPDYIRPGKTQVESSFEKIKRIRKSIKEKGFHITGNLSDIEVPRELSFFRGLLKHIAEGKSPLDMYRVSVLCQTRASGVPPKTVYEKTFSKMKEVLRTSPDPAVYARSAPYIKECMEQVHGEYCAGKSEDELGNIWARLQRAAKVSLSDSAEIFHGTESGGKLEAAREVLSTHPAIPEISLEDGKYTGKILTEENATVGERLFAWALGHVDVQNAKKTYDSNIMSVKISLVAEMGKYRGITVSHLAHAVILHVFSHVGLEYLRGIPSSQSGISAANHAWNFFKRMTNANPAGDFIFGDEDIYLFSTDWETATDFMEHRVTADMLNHFCTILGIPQWYRRVIVLLLCQPRQVEFLDEESRILDRFYTGRGTLMGDPVTKVVLHLYHLICRKAAKYTAETNQQ